MGAQSHLALTALWQPAGCLPPPLPLQPPADAAAAALCAPPCTQVHVARMGSGLVAEESMDVFCGSGDQILQWVGFTACARLAYKKGATLGCYVPQSVLTKDGQPLDVDIVLSELASDGT